MPERSSRSRHIRGKQHGGEQSMFPYRYSISFESIPINNSSGTSSHGDAARLAFTVSKTSFYLRDRRMVITNSEEAKRCDRSGVITG